MISINYTPKPKQSVFHISNEVEAFFGGAKSPGKSCALVMEAVQYCLDYPGVEAYLFRKTFDDLKANLVKEFIERVPQEIYTYNQAEHIATFKNKSKIYFRYIRNLIDAYSYNGRSIPWIGIDELTEHKLEAVQILLSCNRCATGYPVRFRATGNPGNIGHGWVKERYIQPTKYGKQIYTDAVTGNTIRFIPATVYDGVLLERDPAYVKRLENLPETEKQAYLYGNWDIFEGQFFMELGEHNKEKPFKIPPDAYGRVWVSLDHGITHPTSAGIYYMDNDFITHRICSYLNNGGTTEGHARAIWEMIESSPWLSGLWPDTVYYDPSMETQRKLSESLYQSDIGIYKDFFGGKEQSKGVQFLPANNRKVDGCHIMREMLAIGDGKPKFMYFDGLNASFVDGVKAVLTDKNNREIYAKMEGDDAADDARYGIVAGYTRRGQMVKSEKEKKEAERIPVDTHRGGSWMAV